MFSTVYHTTSIFQPSTEVNREQFEARIHIIGRRLERYVERKVWHLLDQPDDLDDAIQAALIRLWKLYQSHPALMDMGDGMWLKVAWRAAQNALNKNIAQRGLKTAKGLRRLEFTAASLMDDHAEGDWDGLEMAEVRHFHRSFRLLRAESEQVDRRLDTERLITAALARLTEPQQAALRLLIPLVSEGYPLLEAARHAGLNRTRAQYAWEALCQQCEQISGQRRDHLKGKGTPATAEELEQIRQLAETGLSCAKIAQQLGRNKQFVKNHFERATGYRRGSNNRNNPITPHHVEQMKTLQQKGLSMAAIGKVIGCSAGSVHHWLHQ